MSKDIVLIKVNNGLQYATDADRENCANWKLGQAVKVTAVKQSKRSLKHHRLYWAGLLAITLEYWEPCEGMTTESERKLIEQFCSALDGVTGGSEIMIWGNDFLSTLSQKRAQKIQAPNKTIGDLHDWIKDKAGHYEIVITPSGSKRKLKSINFNSMGNEDFKAYYKKAHDVCWRYILNQSFKSETELDNAINELLSVG